MTNGEIQTCAYIPIKEGFDSPVGIIDGEAAAEIRRVVSILIIRWKPYCDWLRHNGNDGVEIQDMFVYTNIIMDRLDSIRTDIDGKVARCSGNSVSLSSDGIVS
jgi:hypothetical protein